MKTFLVLTLLMGALAVAKSTLVVRCYGSVAETLQKALPLWNTLHPEVKVEVIPLDYGEHHTSLTTALATGEGAGDVACIEVGFVRRLNDSGGLEDLNQPPYQLQQFEGQLTPYVWGQTLTHDGKRFVVPLNVAPGTLFYLPELLQKARVSTLTLTRSWDSYLEAGRNIKAATGAYLMHDARFMARMYLEGTVPPGGSLYFDLQGHPVLNSPRFKEAFRLARRVRDLKLDAGVGEWSPEWEQLMASGKIATFPFGSWFEGYMQDLFPDQRGKWRATALPASTHASWGGDFLAIPRESKEKTLAWEFIRFVALSKSGQLENFRTSGMLPALKSAQLDSLLRRPFPYLGGQVAARMWIKVAGKIPVRPPYKRDVLAERFVEEALNSVLNGNSDIDTALDQAQTLLASWGLRRGP